jgi:hypothetical protein
LDLPDHFRLFDIVYASLSFEPDTLSQDMGHRGRQELISAMRGYGSFLDSCLLRAMVHQHFPHRLTGDLLLKTLT